MFHQGPPNNVTSRTAGIAEKLFTVSEQGEIVPQVAESVSHVSELVWDVTLKEDYKFSDGTDVTAAHVADCLNELNEENSSAQSSIGAFTATATGDLTVRIESERATHVMDAVLAEWVFAVYYHDGDMFYFTGPYAVAGGARTVEGQLFGARRRCRADAFR